MAGARLIRTRRVWIGIGFSYKQMNKKRISQILLGLYSLAFFASGVAALVGVEALADTFTALGYPAYLMTILGSAYILGAIALWQPVSAQLKEWAFAGFTIANLGGMASHILNGDPIPSLIPLIVLWAILMTAYFLGHRATFAK